MKYDTPPKKSVSTSSKMENKDVGFTTFLFNIRTKVLIQHFSPFFMIPLAKLDVYMHYVQGETCALGTYVEGFADYHDSLKELDLMGLYLEIYENITDKTWNGKSHKMMTGLSMLLSILMVLFLKMTREAYAIMLAFMLLLIKGLLLQKYIR